MPWFINDVYEPLNLKCDIAVLNKKRFDYCGIISGSIKNEAINLLQNANLTEKAEYYINVKICYFV